METSRKKVEAYLASITDELANGFLEAVNNNHYRLGLFCREVAYELGLLGIYTDASKTIYWSEFIQLELIKKSNNYRARLTKVA